MNKSTMPVDKVVVLLTLSYVPYFLCVLNITLSQIQWQYHVKERLLFWTAKCIRARVVYPCLQYGRIDSIYQGWDDTVRIDTISIQRATDTYRYSHPVVSIHKYGNSRKNETTIPERKFLFFENKIFEHLSSPICLMKNLVKTEY